MLVQDHLPRLFHHMVKIIRHNFIAVPDNFAQFAFQSVQGHTFAGDTPDQVQQGIFQIHFASEQKIQHNARRGDQQGNLHRTHPQFHDEQSEQNHAENRRPRIERNTEAGTVIMDAAFPQNDDRTVGQDE